ncbi:MAG: beta-lactamase family protein [Gemmatimonadota bacterium]|nr:MAG: beta-lactamase family protein [Gemmatimonadota bacterium]
MKRTLAALALLHVFALPSLGAVQRPQHDTATLTREIDALFAEWDIPGSPGGAVVLTRGGEMILRRSYGLADIEHGIPITAETRFELASVSKPFTAFAVLLLEQAGQLRLEDDIRQFFPEFPDFGSPITIADLLHHTSGLSDWVRVLPYAGRPTRAEFSVDDLIRLVAGQRMLEFTPGTRWSYSNTNYALLAELVARVTERPFGEWMRDNVFAPLGMHQTSFPPDGAYVLPNRANAYSSRAGGEFVRSLVEGFEIPGSAHAFSTIDDMALWIDNFRTGRVGGLELIGRMQERTTLTTGERSFYGAGLGMGEYRGIRTAGHSGQTGAFKTELLYCPDIEVGVVVLGNAGWMRADDMARRVLDVHLRDELEPLPEAAEEPTEAPFIDLDPAEYERFLGGYRLDADTSVLVAVAREGRWLVGAIVGQGIGLFRPLAPSLFENRYRNFRLEFFDEPGAGAAARVQITRRSGEQIWATRIQLPSDTPAVNEFVGLYYSDELEVAYEIVSGPDGLAVITPNSRSRPLQRVDIDILAGGIGILTFRRDDGGRLIGFDFGEPEDLGERLIRFYRCGECSGR